MGKFFGRIGVAYSTTYKSPIGNLTLACEDGKLVGLWMEGQKYYVSTISSLMVEKNDPEVFDLVKKWLDRYFGGEKVSPAELPMAPSGSDFRKEVWKILCEIPYGEVVTYGDIAKKMASLTGKKMMSAQAVGGAVGHNPISVIIPCHRVVGASGSLTGYAGGMAKKVKLLEIEGVDVAKFSIPLSGTAV